ncbi:hypothetical protein ACEUZ9_002701 [Paracoccus litorisediminis]|uniref:hypothetical protein n=1 Tax=Paracoccus litorisediminis TaxID=2006130 RepID=UPI00372F2D0E
MSKIEPLVLLSAAEKAVELQLSTKTLHRLRAEGKGPRYIRVGRMIRYLPFTMELELGGEGEVNRAVLAKLAKTRLRQSA